MGGSTPLTISIMWFSVLSGVSVRKPASPSIDFSISALHGHTVTQWPQETQLEPSIFVPPSQSTRGGSLSQLIDSVSFTCTFWHDSMQRPHRMHWSGS